MAKFITFQLILLDMAWEKREIELLQGEIKHISTNIMPSILLRALVPLVRTAASACRR